MKNENKKRIEKGYLYREKNEKEKTK